MGDLGDPVSGVLEVVTLDHEDPLDLAQAGYDAAEEPHRHGGGSRCAHQVCTGGLLDEAEDDLPGHARQGLLGEVGPRGRWSDAHLVRHELHPLVEQLASSRAGHRHAERSEEHTSELQSLMRISYAVFCLKKKHKK